jgi:hypothetical protein
VARGCPRTTTGAAATGQRYAVGCVGGTAPVRSTPRSGDRGPSAADTARTCT